MHQALEQQGSKAGLALQLVAANIALAKQKSADLPGHRHDQEP